MQARQIHTRFAQRAGAACTLAVVAVALLVGVVTPSAAQKSAGRKVLVTVKPEYPETLKFAQIGGLVRLSATVLPNGNVSQVEVRGGNPILAEKAQAAVMKWKYAPAANQTVEEISLSFSPH